MSDIIWTCASCGREIADGDGWVHVSMSRVQDCESARTAWHEQHPGPSHTMADLAEYPDPVPWQAHHGECDPTDGEPYTIDVADLRTPWDLIKWTAHLMEKTWLGVTDWRELLRKKHHEAGAPV